MIVRFIEASSQGNWGKFAVMKFDKEEWGIQSSVLPVEARRASSGLLASRGWSRDNIIVFDLETGEGARFRVGGLAKADLDKHRIWVCPLFEPFLEWLYRQDLTNLYRLPQNVELPNAPFAMYGYRREG